MDKSGVVPIRGSSESDTRALQAAAWSEIENIVSSEHFRPAAANDVIDGVQPQHVVEPGNAEETARVLAAATKAEMTVATRGKGSKLEWGNAPRVLHMVLSTRRLNRVLEHAWADMTATVEAGCTVADVQRVLAERGQQLAVDPLWPERATIGGILATNDSGALRVRFGSLRDLIIGITLALPDGTLAKSGGKVVKNVAGYDLPKLATGSLGTLGVITQAIFRLHPLPKQIRTVTYNAPTIELLNQLVLAVQASTLAFTGLQIRAASDSPPQMDIRFAGVAAGIDAQVQQLGELARAAVKTGAPGDVWSTRESLWDQSKAAMVVKFSVLPSQISRIAEFAQRLCGTNSRWKMVAQAVGIGLLRIESPTANALVDVLSRLRAEVNPLGGSVVVLHCPAEVKAHLDVWGYAGDALGLMRRMKQQFDPSGTLNPGRFVGGI